MNTVYTRHGDMYVARRNGGLVGYAHYNAAGNYIDTLYVAAACRRQGIGLALAQHVAAAVAAAGKQLNRCPDALKNDVVRALSLRLGSQLGAVAR